MVRCEKLVDAWSCAHSSSHYARSASGSSDHIAGRSRKGDKMRALVAQQFRAHANEKDEDKIESLKRK